MHSALVVGTSCLCWTFALPIGHGTKAIFRCWCWDWEQQIWMLVACFGCWWSPRGASVVIGIGNVHPSSAWNHWFVSWFHNFVFCCSFLLLLMQMVLLDVVVGPLHCVFICVVCVANCCQWCCDIFSSYFSYSLRRIFLVEHLTVHSGGNLDMTYYKNVNQIFVIEGHPMTLNDIWSL